MELFPQLSPAPVPKIQEEILSPKNPNEGISINFELIEKPVLRMHSHESPEDPDPKNRELFYHHSCHFFIFTTAGKPIFTRYGDEFSVASLCASYAAILPKLHCMYSDQYVGIACSGIRYIKTKELLIVFMIRKNIVFLCIHKGNRGYMSIHRQLEYLSVQVFFLFQNLFYIKNSLFQC